MLSNKQLEKYLKRINHQGSLSSDIPTLTALHRAHIENIPFENLDIFLGNKIKLSLDSQFKKIVLQNRGGICYELNFIFFALLSACNFKVSLLAAQVYSAGIPGRKFDHLLLLVGIAGKKIIADVGFGDSFIEPLYIDTATTKQQHSSYKIEEKEKNKYILFKKKEESEWQPQYIFSLTPQNIDAFFAMCEFHQISPKSNFTKKSLCSIATKSGRKTLSNGKFIETHNGTKSECSISSAEKYREILIRNFQVSLPQVISKAVWKKLGI